MAVETVRPDSTLSAGGAALTGAATLHAATNDDSASSYFTPTGAASTVSFAPPTAGGEVEAKVRVELAKGSLYSSSLEFTSNGTEPLTRSLTVSWSTPSEVVVHAFRESEWPIEAFDTSNPALTVENTTRGASSPRIYELFLDFVSIDAAAVTVTAPSGSISTNLPEITWTEVLDADGGPQSAYEVKVYTDAQYGAGGFSADTSAAFYESGELFGDDLALQLTEDMLPNDTYRAYVRVAQTVNGELVWSAWDFEGFVVDVDLPGEPTLTLTPEDDEGRIKIDLAAPNPITNYSFETATGGTTDWVAVLSAVRTQSTTRSLNGAASLKVETPGSVAQEGIRNNSFACSVSQTHTGVIWVWAPLGATMNFQLLERTAADAAVGTTTTNFDGTGDWQRVEATRAFGGTGAKARFLISTRTSAQDIDFWIDSAGFGAGPLVDTESFQVQHAVGEDEWEDVRTPEEGITDGTAFAYDFEVANGEVASYRARSINGDVYSDWVFETTTWESEDWWLKHPTNPGLSIAIVPRSQPERIRAARRGIFNVLGRSDPVVISDRRTAWTGTIVLLQVADVDREALDALLEATETPVLLQGAADTEAWDDAWVSLGDLNRARAIDAAWGTFTFDTLDWVEVARPSGEIEEWPDG